MKLEVIADDVYTLLAVRSDRGDCPLLEFLLRLEGSMQRSRDKLLALFERVVMHGPPTRAEKNKHLVGKIWELRVDRIRVLFFQDEGKLVIVSHGFVKKTQKTPKREIERAERAFETYSLDKAAGRIEVEM